MKYDFVHMTKEQVEEFQSKGVWWLARCYSLLDMVDGEYVYNPNNSKYWEIEQINTAFGEDVKKKLFTKDLSRYPFGFHVGYSEKTFINTYAYALFDDYDEADKWLAEQYLKSLEKEKNRLADLMKKVDERIEEVKAGKGSYKDTWSIKY